MKLFLKVTGIFVLTLSLFVLSSCTKSADDSLTKEQMELQKKNADASSVDERDFTESDSDLLTIDYKEFYEQLSPFGEWVEVSPEEIGLQPSTALSGSGSSDKYNSSVSTILGTKDAHALADENAEMVYVWKPSPELGVSDREGEAPVFKPYSNGQWINTDAGWYFKAPTPAEETVSHYGRWVNSPTAGWLWVPGRVWSPAWVDWKQNDEYVSWAPLPVSAYLIDNVLRVPVINDADYVIVDRKYFLEPAVYSYNTIYHQNGNNILVKDLTGTDGIVVVNNTIINLGPDIRTIQTIYGRSIDLIKVRHAGSQKEVKYSNREYVIFKPGFKRFKNEGNTRIAVNGPESYKKYDEWNVVKSEEKVSVKKGKETGSEISDNENKKVNSKDIGNKHDSNDNGTKNSKDNGNKNTVKDNGNKNDNKDSGIKKDSKGNGNKHDGGRNGNGKK